MPSTNIQQYDYYIFDCDGVILDSNKLKIDAMGKALQQLNVSKADVQRCCSYFANNFGKSRFHHVEVFVEDLLKIEDNEKASFTERVLQFFSEQCQSLYLTAPMTPGFVELIEQLDGEKYIASGSEQNELRAVFKQRGLEQYFAGIFGSPTPKAKLVKNIIEAMPNSNTVMVGDALSDLQAAQHNHIDFIGYTPFSNVPELLTEQTQTAGFTVIDTWTKLNIN
ncbi:MULTISPECIES: HAD family hydrolase [unclassified Vibrio]|uniref:phosphoglycolate phosphatase n=1 Tax=Vibrio sp. HB236076 TaxID=3232307 RepID=A0AB39HBZ5_9VIBR|nr:HAD-IA family hydrolase [Vibrio sp. HB161653]MDP5254339.1 HAD-IA family hydrolase [Vibrio sp. HB161653]